MVLQKGTQVAQDRRLRRSAVGVRGLKVYSENENVKVDGDSSTAVRKSLLPVRKSLTLNKGATSTSCKDLKIKGISENMQKFKAEGNTQVGRKALADVSNVVGKSSKKVLGSSNQKIFVGPASRVQNVAARKFIAGKGKEILIPRDGINTSKRDIKDLKPTRDSQRTKSKILNHASGSTRPSIARSSLIPTRKSLPAFTMRNLAEKSNPKEQGGSLEKVKGINENKVGKKVIPSTSTAKSYIWKNRASDGFLVRSSKNQSSLDRRLPIRKSVKVQPTMKTGSSKPQKTSKCLVDQNKSLATVPLNKGEAASSSISGVGATEVKGEASSNGNSQATASIIIANSKSSRRRSFTSLLVARSKFLEECGKVTGQENLPSIDNECNQLEVAEYVDDIYRYYWVSEAQSPSLENYMSIQPEITSHMRGILINWLIEVHFRFDLMHETLYLMVTLLDRYLSEVPIKKNEMQLIGLTALLLASKYEDFWHPRIKDLISISAEPYTRGQILRMEKLMLKQLKFRLNAPTLYVFMLRFLKAAQSNKKLEHLAFYLIELCLVKYEALKFKPSLLCASAIYVARCTLNMIPSWTPLLSKYTHYNGVQIRDCAEMILGFHKAAKTGRLKVSYEKYLRPEQGRVAAIQPLERLAF